MGNTRSKVEVALNGSIFVWTVSDSSLESAHDCESFTLARASQSLKPRLEPGPSHGWSAAIAGMHREHVVRTVNGPFVPPEAFRFHLSVWRRVEVYKSGTG